MQPEHGELLHFSEDPSISRFEPHVAATARETEAFVWALDAHGAPSYWFPRDCPRVVAWVTPETSPMDRDRVLGPGGGTRVHAVEYAWLERLARAELFAYRLPADGFRPLGERWTYAFVSTEAVDPTGPPERIDDLIGLHARAGIQLRVLVNLWSFCDFVASSTLGFSGIRLHNAAPRPPVRSQGASAT
jgi:hypothetical protein